MTVNDVIQANEDLIVDVFRLNFGKYGNPCPKCYSGSLHKIPNLLRNCKVLSTGYLSIIEDRFCIVIYPIKKD